MTSKPPAVPGPLPQPPVQFPGPGSPPGAVDALLGSDGFAEAMPQLLLCLLERRYLTDFDPTRWTVKLPSADGSRPLLHEIRALGRPPAETGWAAAVPHVLTACHSGGHLLSVAVHGDGIRHRIHWGGRRLAGTSRGSTEDFLQSQAGVLRAHVPGLELGPADSFEEGTHADLAAFVRTAPALALITGIPAPVHGRSPAAFQSLDRLAAAVGARRYAVVVAAEPLSAGELDRTLDHCRRLRSEIHALVRHTVGNQQGETSSTSTTEAAGSEPGLSTCLTAIAVFCSLAGIFPAVRPLATAAPSVLQLASIAGGPRNTSQTKGVSTLRSHNAELLDATAEACEKLLQQHIDRLETARAQGWWRTAVYLAAESEGALESLAGALRGTCSGEATALDPLRVLRLPPATLRTAALHGRILPLVPASGGMGHPLGPAFDALATCLTSAELAVLVGLPRGPMAGLPMPDVAEFPLSAPPPEPKAVTIGRVTDAQGGEYQQVTVSDRALNRHVFITGMTGYGKTTTAKNLLVEAYTELGVPFLVIEPAKAEYRQLAQHPALKGRLRVYGIGPDAPLPLRLNPFAPVASVPLSRHIDLLKAVFNASFPMFAGMSYVLEDAMLEVYTERGWDLHTSANELLGARPSAPDVAALTPTIRELQDKIEEVLERRAYGREVHQNLGAALRSRLGSLVVGTKGMALDTRRSVPVEDLFARPALIELRNLGDDEEKSFVMALLLCRLYEYAESRAGAAMPEGEELRHLTLIEEAHRLLRAARPPSGAETPDAQAKAVAMFTDMLAEMRAYGEGFIVADQVPTKLAPEIVKNSNVKILHRLVAADDRAVVAATVNLTEQQSRHLATLPPGEAVVHDERIGSAVLARMRPPEPLAVRVQGAAGAPAEADRAYLHRHGGCRRCPAPCTVLHLADRDRARAAADQALSPFFDRLLLGTPEQLWEAWTAWRSSVPAGSLAYCTYAQAARRRLDGLGAPDRGAEFLGRDRAARILARLGEGWLKAEHLDGSARELLSEIRADLNRTIGSRPPRELSGCATCPSRCRVLPLVAPAVQALAASVSACADRPVPLDTRLRQLDALAEEHLPHACQILSEGQSRRSLLYCMTVNATAATSRGRRPTPAMDAAVAETLAALRSETL
ncbi:ATP-binding protein [Streptomyces griseochromogenes]|uniref:ATP-binding protein n=1 Tax=Streptomyces griseochromogenes TaxID=68214 RepID=UPI0037B39415